MSDPTNLPGSLKLPGRSKPGWTWVKFGDVVKLNTDRIADPAAAGIERYVGLEHIEPEDLRIRRWGLVADGTTFTNYFKPGQTLFGKRRAYQRKVAVADFEGVCSGDIYIFEPKNDCLLPELLPFICQTERFYEYAVGTSAGSLSPRTNWTQLTQYEFALPPLTEQRRMAEVLWAAQETIWELQEAFEKAKEVENALFCAFLQGEGVISQSESKETVFGLVPKDWPLMVVSQIGDVAYGISAAVSNNTDPSMGWPILTGANITLEGTLDLQKIVYHPKPHKPDFVLQKGDVLLNWRSGSKEHVGKAAIFELDGNWTYASFILRIRPNELMNNVFLWRLLNYMRRYELFGRSTSQQVNFKMNASYFRQVELVTPPRNAQDYIVSVLEKCWETQKSLTKRFENTQSILKQLMNKSIGV